MELSQRKKKILAAVIEDYIETAEPVGSKTIARKSGLGVSSATIRNEVAELESMGYLEQPHTSAGRVPSPKGYRLYVNELMLQYKLSIQEAESINQKLNLKLQQLDKLITDVGKLASQLTNYPTLSLAAPVRAVIKRFDLIYIDANTFIIVSMLSNDAVKNKLIHLPFSVEEGAIRKLSAVFNAHFTGVTEDRITANLINSAERATGDTMGLVSIIAGFAIEVLSETGAAETYVTGASQLLTQPEFRDPDKAQRLLSYLSDGQGLLSLPGTVQDDEVKVLIGPENAAEELKDSSVVLASYNIGDDAKGLIGVVGPTRMDYSKVAARLGYIASGISRALGASGPPEGWGKLTIKGDDIDGS